MADSLCWRAARVALLEPLRVDRATIRLVVRLQYVPSVFVIYTKVSGAVCVSHDNGETILC